jgi:hypothetical protein
MMKKVAFDGLGTMATTAIATAAGMPSLGLAGLAFDARRMLKSGTSGLAHPAQNPHMKPVSQKPGYVDVLGTPKGTHHIGGINTATPASTGSFADYTDVVRGVKPTANKAVGMFGGAHDDKKVPNVFEQKFASMKFTDAQHENNQSNLAKIEDKFSDVTALVTGARKMDATKKGVMSEVAWNHMDNEHKRGVYRRGGQIDLIEAGTVDPNAIAKFAVGSFEPRKGQQMALTLG